MDPLNSSARSHAQRNVEMAVVSLSQTTRALSLLEDCPQSILNQCVPVPVSKLVKWQLRPLRDFFSEAPHRGKRCCVI